MWKTQTQLHNLQTQNESPIHSAYRYEKQNKKKHLSFVCLLFTFHFRCQLGRSKFRYSNYACLLLEHPNGVNIPKQKNSRKHYAQTILFNFIKTYTLTRTHNKHFAKFAFHLARSSVGNLVGRLKINPNLVANELLYRAANTQPKSHALKTRFFFWFKIQYGGPAVSLFRLCERHSQLSCKLIVNSDSSLLLPLFSPPSLNFLFSRSLPWALYSVAAFCLRNFYPKCDVVEATRKV